MSGSETFSHRNIPFGQASSQAATSSPHSQGSPSAAGEQAPGAFNSSSPPTSPLDIQAGLFSPRDPVISRTNPMTSLSRQISAALASESTSSQSEALSQTWIALYQILTEIRPIKREFRSAFFRYDAHAEAYYQEIEEALLSTLDAQARERLKVLRDHRAAYRALYPQVRHVEDIFEENCMRLHCAYLARTHDSEADQEIQEDDDDDNGDDDDDDDEHDGGESSPATVTNVFERVRGFRDLLPNRRPILRKIAASEAQRTELEAELISLNADLERHRNLFRSGTIPFDLLWEIAKCELKIPYVHQNISDLWEEYDGSS